MAPKANSRPVAAALYYHGGKFFALPKVSIQEDMDTFGSSATTADLAKILDKESLAAFVLSKGSGVQTFGEWSAMVFIKSSM